MSDFRNKNPSFDLNEPSSNNISFDYEDMIDAQSSLKIKNEAEQIRKRLNIFKSVKEYVGLIIQISTEEQYRPPGIVDVIQDPFGQETRRAYFKAHIPNIHASIGNPCDIGYLKRFSTQEQRINAALKRIENHPWFLATYQAGLFNSRAPTFGDIIKIKFLKSPAGGKLVQGEIVEIISRGNGESLDNLCGNTNTDLFGGFNPNYGATLLGTLGTGGTPTGKIHEKCDPNNLYHGGKPNTQFDLERYAKELAAIESGGKAYNACNDKPQENQKEPTAALGKYQFLPYWHWDSIISFAKTMKPPRFLKKPPNGYKGDLCKTTPEYQPFLNDPELQEGYFREKIVGHLKYIPDLRKNRPNAAYYSDGQLLALIHHRGIGSLRDNVKGAYAYLLQHPLPDDEINYVCRVT